MGNSDSKSDSAAAPSIATQVQLDTESSEDENLEIINILNNVVDSTDYDDQDTEETIVEGGAGAVAPKAETSSDYYTSITKYSQSLWSTVTTNNFASRLDSNAKSGEDSSISFGSVVLEGSVNLLTYGRNLTAQMETLVKDYYVQDPALEKSSEPVSIIGQFCEPGNETLIIATTAHCEELRQEYLKVVQQETPLRITEVRLAESYSEGNGELFSLTELITGVRGEVVESEIENLMSSPQKTVIWRSDSALLIRFGSSKKDKIILIDEEGAGSEEDYLSVCALFQEYRTRQAYELVVSSAAGDEVEVRSLRVWYEVVDLSLFMRLRDDLVDQYDEDLLFVLPVPVFESGILVQFDFARRQSKGELGVLSGRGSTFFRCIFEHLSALFEADILFIYLRDLSQFLQRSGIPSGSAEGSISGADMVIVLRYLNHHLPEDRHRLLLRLDGPGLLSGSGVSLKFYHEEFLPSEQEDSSKPLPYPLGSVCLLRDKDGLHCRYDVELVPQAVEDLIVRSRQVRWPDILSQQFH